MAWPATEVELAKSVVDWLTDLRWEVFQEVNVGQGGATADIVARQGGIYWVIETKRSACLDVISQANDWRPFAHFVSVAVPHGKNWRSRAFAGRVCEMFGVGMLLVQEDWSDMRENNIPKLNRKPALKRWAGLMEEHKTFAKAGQSGGGYWTPFKATCRDVLEFVQKKGGKVSAKDLVGGIKTHYASTSCARSCLMRWGRNGIIPGVKVVDEGRHVFFSLA